MREALDEASPGRRVPLLVKIAPDLADADINAVADLALDLRLDGIIATNTTISRAGLRDSAAVADAGPGGMSGAPLRGRALEVLRRLHDRTGDRLILIAAGGIESADDARERLAAGATLLQAYTAFIYEGPLWPHRVQAELARPSPRSVAGGERRVIVFLSAKNGPKSCKQTDRMAPRNEENRERVTPSRSVT